MTAEPEIIPVIRDWLAATSDTEVPAGLSCEEARRRAHRLLSHIEAGDSALACTELDEDSKDVLWAVVEILAMRSAKDTTFAICDQAYQLVSKLSWPDDHFGELDEILCRIAQIGWRATAGGIDAVTSARGKIWEHGDANWHREICAAAEGLRSRISSLEKRESLDSATANRLCAELFKLTSIRPLITQSCAAAAFDLATHAKRIGHLDDRFFFAGSAALYAGMAARQRGLYDQARLWYGRSERMLLRSADRARVEMIEVERLAVKYLLQDFTAVLTEAPILLDRLQFAREKVRTQLVLSATLISESRPAEARAVLEAAAQAPILKGEPALQAWLFTKLGNALSYLGLHVEAMASFDAAAKTLNGLEHPLMLSDLIGVIGEHLTKLGNLEQALGLYLSARDGYRRVGHLQLVCYISVLVAELLILLGRNREAEEALREAIPLAEEFHFEREGVAALALLRESVGRQRTDVTALKSLRDHLRKGFH